MRCRLLQCNRFSRENYCNMKTPQNSNGLIRDEHTGSFKASLASSPYLFLKQGPQNWKLKKNVTVHMQPSKQVTTQIPDRTQVASSFRNRNVATKNGNAVRHSDIMSILRKAAQMFENISSERLNVYYFLNGYMQRPQLWLSIEELLFLRFLPALLLPNIPHHDK